MKKKNEKIFSLATHQDNKIPTNTYLVLGWDCRKKNLKLQYEVTKKLPSRRIAQKL